MGMFDSFRDAAGNEWQTKAYDLQLMTYRIGDRVPPLDSPLATYQVEVLGGDGSGPTKRFIDALATVRDGVLVEVPAARDESVPLIDYCGDPTP